MKFTKLIAARPAAAVAVALLGAAGLAACGSGAYVPTPDPVTPAPTADAFFTAVSGIVASTPEETEPVAIEAYAATVPDNSEPVAF